MIDPLGKQSVSGLPRSNSFTNLQQFTQPTPLPTRQAQIGLNPVPLLSNTIIELPIKRTKNAPRTFKGKYNRVKEFFTEVEAVCQNKNVWARKEKCEAVVRYCSDAVIKVIRGLQSYKDHDYDTLKNDLIFIYDGERAETEYGIADMYPLVKKWSKTSIHDLSTYKNYLKEFQTIAGWLHVRNKINDDEFKLWFWAGLPKKLQKKIEDRLRIEDPRRDESKAFEIKKITEAVRRMYTRDRFENRIPVMMKSRSKKIRDESSSESSDSEDWLGSESSEESEDEDAQKSVATRIRKLKKPKRKVRFEDDEPPKNAAKKPIAEPNADDAVTGGEGQYTQWVHCELIVGFETIRPANTQWVSGERFQKVPTNSPSPNPVGK